MNNTIKYNIWHSPDQENVYFKDFYNLQNSFEKLAILGIHFFIYKNFIYESIKKSPIKNCLIIELDCIRPGKSGASKGANFIGESIRQNYI